MDRSRRRSAAALAAVSAILAGAGLAGKAPAAGGGSPIRAMAWLRPDADLTAALGSAPSECLRPAMNEADRRSREIGRAAFRSPLTLGGVAARAGLACDNCHRSGHSNPDFLFPGVSGGPGSADVTSSLFSSHRGDGVRNPIAIPDLTGGKPALKVDQAPSSARLERFIHGLVVEEFDGPEPTPATLNGLAAYVRALDPAACPAPARTPVTAASLMEDARRAVTAASDAADGGDMPTAVTLIAAARGRLGLIDERFSAPNLAGDRARLRGLDRRLGRFKEAVRRRQWVRRDAEAWIGDSERVARRLASDEGRSLFAPDRLRQARAAPAD